MDQRSGRLAPSARLHTPSLLRVGGFSLWADYIRPNQSAHAKPVMAAIQSESFLQPDLLQGLHPLLHPPPPFLLSPRSRHVSSFIHPPQQRDYLSPEVRSVFWRQPHPSGSQIKGISSKGKIQFYFHYGLVQQQLLRNAVNLRGEPI